MRKQTRMTTEDRTRRRNQWLAAGDINNAIAAIAAAAQRSSFIAKYFLSSFFSPGTTHPSTEAAPISLKRKKERSLSGKLMSVRCSKKERTRERDLLCTTYYISQTILYVCPSCLVALQYCYYIIQTYP